MSSTNPNARVGDTQMMGGPASFVATRENELLTENAGLRERAKAADAALRELHDAIVGYLATFDYPTTSLAEWDRLCAASAAAAVVLRLPGRAGDAES